MRNYYEYALKYSLEFFFFSRGHFKQDLRAVEAPHQDNKVVHISDDLSLTPKIHALEREWRSLPASLPLTFIQRHGAHSARPFPPCSYNTNK